MSAYQATGNAYQGAGLFAYQIAAGLVPGVFGTPRAHLPARDPFARIGGSPDSDPTSRIGAAPSGPRRRIGRGS